MARISQPAKQKERWPGPSSSSDDDENDAQRQAQARRRQRQAQQQKQKQQQQQRSLTDSDSDSEPDLARQRSWSVPGSTQIERLRSSCLQKGRYSVLVEMGSHWDFVALGMGSGSGVGTAAQPEELLASKLGRL